MTQGGSDHWCGEQRHPSEPRRAIPSSQGLDPAPSSPGSRGGIEPRSRSASSSGPIRKCLWAGEWGLGGECPMGIKTRGQMEGTVQRPEWLCASRGGCDRAVGQDGLRERQESNPH